jgi:hypothetical protein
VVAAVCVCFNFFNFLKLKNLIRDYISSKQLATVNYCMPLDDGRMTETCCGNNIGRGGEELLR